MRQSAEKFLQLIGIRRRDRDRRETEARLAHEAYAAAELALDQAQLAVDAACKTCEKAQRARAEAPGDMLVFDYCRAEHLRLDVCKQDAAARSDALRAAQRDLLAARHERQRAQARLDLLETELAAAKSQERRRMERKRDDALTINLPAPSC